MKNIIIVFINLIVLAQITAQTGVPSRMQQDLEIAESVLEAILEKNGGNRFYLLHNDGVEAKYIGNYGVVISYQPQSTFNLTSSYYNDTSGDVSSVFYEGAKKGHLSPESKGGQFATIIKGGKNNLKKINMDTAILEFLADYGGIIRDLPDDQKIMVKSDSKQNFPFVLGSKNVSFSGPSFRYARPQRKTFVVKKSDIDLYDKGKIDRWEFFKRAEIKSISGKEMVDKEAEIFISVFKRLYQPDISNTYFLANQPWYDKLSAMETIFFLKYYSSEVNNLGYFLPTREKSGLSKKDRNDIVEKMYPEFKENFISNILNYGHLLRGLGAEETITFEVELTECHGCEMPDNLIVSVKKAVIDDFRDDKINLEQAKAKITITEY